jgi:hypothetical protein
MNMKSVILLLCALAMLCEPARAAAKPTAFDLVGKWEGAVEFGKFTFKLVLRVSKTSEGRLAVVLDIPDQGQKGLPVNALLFNNPDVRIEIDQFGSAYKGALSADLMQIDGAFEEGPGGRPMPVVFKRSTQPDAPEPEKVFTFAKGEPMDIRGYWKGNLEAGPGMNLAVILNIGRIPDGSFRATLDLPEQGAKDIPASSVTMTNQMARLEWKAFQGSLLAKMSEDAKTLDGNWLQGGRTNPVTFKRLDGPVAALPKELSFERDKSVSEDPRGYWKGVLEVGGGQLHLVLKIGKTPDGTYAATMASIEQGGREIPASSASFTAPKLKMEWKGIRGKFEGKINKEGTEVDGKWEQIGDPLPLKLERTATFEGDKKP